MIISTPIFKYLISLTAGIFLAYAGVVYDLKVGLTVMTLCIFATVWLIIKHKIKLHISHKVILNFAQIIFFINLGIMCGNLADITQDADFVNDTNNISAYTGIIDSEVEERTNTYRFILHIENIKQNKVWIKSNAYALIYIKKPAIHNLQYGKKLLILGSFEPISAAKNPLEFDIKQYYARRQVHFRHFVALHNVEITGEKINSYILYYSMIVRDKVNMIFAKYIPDEREKNVACALVLGIKNTIDSEILSAYSATGTMHVLAVSGMHVGIIFQVLNMLFSFLGKIKNGTFLRNIIVLFLLWVYAFVTGMCPSVLRAVVMLSFVIGGKFLKQRSSMHSTLSLSAFAILCFSPHLIFDVGFQLSYLAVLGIVVLHPHIEQLFKSENYIIDFLWQIICMSIAAQIATFPIGLYYFHQFPNYFLLSNIVVVPWATFIMYSGFIFLSCSWHDWLGHTLGWALGKQVWGLNSIILWLEKMPYATIGNISISTLEVYLIYGIIAAAFIAINYKNIVALLLTSVLIISYCATHLYTFFQKFYDKKLIIYHINNASVVEFITKKNVYYYASNLHKYETRGYDFYIKNHHIASLAEHSHKLKLHTVTGLSGIGVLTYNNCTILIYNADNLLIDAVTKHKIPVNYILIGDKKYHSLENIVQNYTFGTLIIDGSVPAYLVKKYIKEANKLNIDVHFTGDMGAFIASWH
ncbi:MAG: ComEC/Rec2 family competence protein [Cytophagales bacterium]|nr:ComEC/Rec2 family competence protein [Cytophagales bacterium]